MAEGLDKKLLEILACPKCKGSLDYRKEKQRLECRKCMLAYKIEKRIPIMLVEKAEKIQKIKAK